MKWCVFVRVVMLSGGLSSPPPTSSFLLCVCRARRVRRQAGRLLVSVTILTLSHGVNYNDHDVKNLHQYKASESGCLAT